MHEVDTSLSKKYINRLNPSNGELLRTVLFFDHAGSKKPYNTDVKELMRKEVYKDLLTGHVDNELQRSEVPIQ